MCFLADAHTHICITQHHTVYTVNSVKVLGDPGWYTGCCMAAQRASRLLQHEGSGARARALRWTGPWWLRSARGWKPRAAIMPPSRILGCALCAVGRRRDQNVKTEEAQGVCD